VTPVIRRLRGLFISLVVLALSAGVVFGWNGPKGAATDGLTTAGDASGQTLPARADEQPIGDEEQADEEDTEAPETDDPAEDSATDTHGDLVSEAAQMDTPAGFANHGAFVSCVAKMNHGLAPDATPPSDLGALTPDDCAPVEATTQSSTHGPKAPKDHTVHGKSGQPHGHNS
jgi:hypothetical protein